MNINWKVRFKNKVWLSGFLGCIVSFVYSILSQMEIVPPLTENTVFRMVECLLFILSALGVIVDPTTAGMEDSSRAMSYEEPWDDTKEE